MSSETDDILPDGHRDKRSRVSSSEKSDIEEEVLTISLDWLNAGKNGEDLGSDITYEDFDGIFDDDMNKPEDSSVLPQFCVDETEILRNTIEQCAFFNSSSSMSSLIHRDVVPDVHLQNDDAEEDCLSQLSSDSTIISLHSIHARRRSPDIFGTVLGASQSESYPREQIQLSKTLQMSSNNIRDLINRELGNETADANFRVRKTIFWFIPT
jgi:hypothetical protein